MDRATLAQEAVDDFVRRRGAGESISEAAFVAENRNLLPELGRILRTLQIIDRARIRAESTIDRDLKEADDTADQGSSSPWLESDSFPGYEIVRRIRSGGQGVVFESVQLATRRRVAIKVMREGPFCDLRERVRFEREVQVLAALNHPHIVTIHDSGTSRGQFYYVMDYISGESFEDSISKTDESIRETLRFFEMVAIAVNAAHLRGVTHRDLKPGNIQIDEQGEPHILDFGLAKVDESIARPEGNMPAMTVTGQFVGSLPWASPEQTEGVAGEIDIRTDVYSLGVMLYQRLTGKFPYPVGGSIREVMNNIAHWTPDRPSSIRAGVDDEVDTIVLKSLSKERDRRYQSAGELARDIRHYLAGEPIDAKRDSSWYLFKKTIRRYKVPTSFALAAVILVVAFSLVMWRQNVALQRESTFNRLLATQVLDLFQIDSKEADGGQGSYTTHFLEKGSRIDSQFEDHPDLQVQTREVLATTLVRLHREDAAVEWIRKALQLHREVLFSDERTIAKRLLWLAVVLGSKGDPDEAERAFAEAVSFARQLEESRDILADILLEESKFLSFRNNQHDRGYQKAEEAFSIYRSLPSRDNDTAARRFVKMFVAFGGITHDRGDYQLAENHYLNAIAACEKAGLDSAHPKTLLALCYKDKANSLDAEQAEARAEKYSAAEQLLQDVLRHALTTDAESLTAALAHDGLAKLYVDSDKLNLAVEHGNQQLRLKRQIYGDDHFRTAIATVLWSRIRLKQGEYRAAHEKLQPAVKILQTDLLGHWETAKAESVLGSIKAGLGQQAKQAGYDQQAEAHFAAAKHLVSSSYPKILKDRGEAHYRTREAVERAIFVFEQCGESEEADRWRERLRHPQQPIEAEDGSHIKQ